jgi:hypothetical protein
MIPTIAALTGADEHLNHQIANTHATVETADRGWTEKVWMTLFRKDGSLQASFGLGKYSNRNVLDGFAGVQQGTSQRTVRASRVLRPAIETLAVGPLRYEVLEPFRRIRFRCAPNAAQPIAYDLTFTDLLPAFFEGRDREVHNGRLATDVIRYHQAGTATGWIEIDGERITVEPDDWFGVRDHSWGVREHVGADPTDLVPPAKGASTDFHFNWLVSCLTRPDGSRYGIDYYFREFREPRGVEFFTGHINEADGRQARLLRVYPELTYRRSDRSVIGGKIYALVAGGGRDVEERVFEVEALDPEMGFRLQPGGYGAWKGQIHGSYKGEDFLDGDLVEDVNTSDKLAASPRWEIRDRPLRIREGDAVGYADIESLVRGDWPAANMV